MARKRVWFLVLLMVLAMGFGLAVAQDDTKIAGTEEELAKKDKSVTGLWDLYIASMPEGGVITGLSVWMIALILTSALTLKHSDLIPPALVEQVDEQLRSKQAKAALEVCQADESLLARMMAAGISRVGRGYQGAVDYMSDVGAEESMKLSHKLSYLSVIGSISPMLGLMGTVRGMIGAFAQLSSSGAQPSPAELSGNIQLALVTTFEGLLVAVPALFAYSLFRNHLARTVTEAEMVALELMSRFQGVTAPLSRMMRPGAGPTPATETPPAIPPDEGPRDESSS